MTQKSLEYRAGLNKCLAMAHDTATTEIAELWLNVADSYRLLLKLEELESTDRSADQHPARAL